MEFGQTQKFFNREYSINNPKGICLRIEDVVIVHPRKLVALIISKQVKIGEEITTEICVKPAGEPRLIMTEDVFKTLEPVEMQYEKDPGLPDLTLFEG